MELERQASPSALALSAERGKKKYRKFWFLSSEDLSNTLAAKQQREFSIWELVIKMSGESEKQQK